MPLVCAKGIWDAADTRTELCPAEEPSLKAAYEHELSRCGYGPEGACATFVMHQQTYDCRSGVWEVTYCDFVSDAGAGEGG